jgi:hypothetical protein
MHKHFFAIWWSLCICHDALGKLKTLLDNDVARFNPTTGAQVGVSAKP